MLSLYVHIPFCAGKCRYCGFFSTVYTVEAADQFLKALGQEAFLLRRQFQDQVFETLYIGGGTPSLLSPRQITDLFELLKANFHFFSGGEWSIEANPDSLSSETFDMLLEAGVNRLSIGVQSFSDEELRVLGRRHKALRAEESVRQAQRSGFRNIGIDLIFGIPGQSLADWEKTLASAVGLGPQHISAYALSLDEGTIFSREAAAGALSLPDEGIVSAMYDKALDMLRGAGYGHYEISNFALPGCECRHNRNYWSRGEYLGLGPGAWSFVRGRRSSNCADICAYEQQLSGGALPTAYEESVGSTEAAAETLLLALRTGEGLDIRDYERLCGRPAAARVHAGAARLLGSGLVQIADGRIRLTARGMFLSDEVIERLWT
ncbi:MAG: hypothetical protein A2X56_03725 [Nitrospirae bacterium GWC2_57_13]|jgi:oxygen-independent coproporphyrinogen III oxidase|nr:MAG: hypothetical protein A2072_06600 [Nitrospirae bacterium GWC1_57_7]OGW29357.1 MAG: hypothetical protein A2X56_03725 [Nitrospirae bacterium GWC2_57_13]HAR45941.1 coproporphyrinogen III oxidase [Nitrospiraceae bacterium]HAS52919.1 coproporphyrinogen III oxidase [Nitrospiraceae bacterium]